MGKGRDRRRRKAKRKVEVCATKADPFGGDLFDPYAPVRAPLRPKPSPRSGAIALIQPRQPMDEENTLANVLAVTARNGGKKRRLCGSKVIMFPLGKVEMSP